jgi:uncharacterized membrane protein
VTTFARNTVAIAALTMLVAACGNAPPPAAAPPAAPAEADAPIAEPATRDPWADAESRGIDFRAVGNEPGWYLEVDYERWMRILYAYGERQAMVPAVQPATTGDVTTFDSSGDGHSIRADITPGPCSDGMSDLTYPLNVSVTVDGMMLRGCGRWLGSAGSGSRQ